jgi:membrane-bound lytic murein transglycosylase D
MRRIAFYILLHLVLLPAVAQVPSEMEFGGMELKLTDGVKKKLQADLDMINRSQKAFQTKVDRADLYFPIIEQIFKEEELPEDFKFLSLQESSLISDAVSTSNAVGYWQFKKETAIEVGLRVDHHVDERMNIVSSSRGAAKYLKKNNTLYFNNWIYALLAYNTGAGGAKSKIKEKYLGAKKMVIDEDMHWYVIRFLAHKLAYENAVGKRSNPSMVLMLYTNCRNKSLQEIAKETQTESQNLEFYNKWLLKGHVPDDKEYYVILPVNAQEKEKVLSNNDVKTKPEKQSTEVKKEGYEVKLKAERNQKRRNQVELSGTGDVAFLISLNGVKTIKAKEGDTPAKLAIQGGISTDDFLRYNDLKSFESIKPGGFYYLQPKKNKGIEFFHIVQHGETLRDISQKHAIRIEAIRKKNRMGKNENPVPGRVLWLRRKRPENVPVEFKKVEMPVIHTKQEEMPKVIKEPVVETIPEPVTSDSLPRVSTIGVTESKLPSESNATSDNNSYHEVKQGETLYAISRLYSLPLDTLKAWNNLYSNDISLGQKLIVKKKLNQGNVLEKSTIEHVVQPGETLYQISKKYGVSVQNIQGWNNKTDTNISLGEKLIIKRGTNQ